MRVSIVPAVCALLAGPAAAGAQPPRTPQPVGGEGDARGGLPQLESGRGDPYGPLPGSSWPGAGRGGYDAGWPTPWPAAGSSGSGVPGIVGGGRPRPHVRPVVIVVGSIFGLPYWGDGLAGSGGFWGRAPGGAQPVDAAPRAARVARTRVIEVGPAAAPDAAPPAAGSITAEPVGDGMLRVRWAGGAADAREVTLVVADSARRVVAAQTVYAAPFAAVFDRAAEVAFVGVTVVRADGGSTTTLVPRAAAARGG